MSSSSKIPGILMASILASIAKQNEGQQRAVSLEDLLSGRQKGQRRSLSDLIFEHNISGKPWSQASEELKQRARDRIIAEGIEGMTTPNCDCEFCVWAHEEAHKRSRNSRAGSGPISEEEMRAADAEVIANVRAQEDREDANTVPGILREAAQQYETKNPLYGDAYRAYGPTMMTFFPDGLFLNEESDWVRFGLFSMMVSKMHRIAANLAAGGHRDSSLDLSVYAAMFTEQTEER